MGEESAVEKLFKTMDKNGDGFVTKEVTDIFLLYYPMLFYCYFWTQSFLTNCNASDSLLALPSMRESKY